MRSLTHPNRKTPKVRVPGGSPPIRQLVLEQQPDSNRQSDRVIQARMPGLHPSKSTVIWPACRISPRKCPWDMPTSQSNSVLETWTHAELVVTVSVDGVPRRFVEKRKS
jgi:hypothetical protein